MAVFDINPIVNSLSTIRQEWRSAQGRSNEPGGREFPSPQALTDILDDLKGVLFPMRLGPLDLRQESENFYIGHTLDSALAKMFTGDKARQLCRDSRDLLGGNGLLLENHVARHLTDMEVVHTYEGTDFIQSLIVGREITGVSAFKR